MAIALEGVERKESIILARGSSPLLLVCLLSLMATLIPSLIMESEKGKVFLMYSPRRLALITACILLLACESFVYVWLQWIGYHRIEEVSKKLVRAFSRPWLAVLLVLLLIEGSMLLSLVIQTVAEPRLRLPIVLSLWIHSAAVSTALMIVNWNVIRNWIWKRQAIWISASMALFVLAVFTVVDLVNSSFGIYASAVERFRVATDFRPHSDPAVDVTKFWNEYARLRTRWMPYVYHRKAPFQGVYHNVNEQGLRKTWSCERDHEQGVPRIYFFGASTAWGLGVRDDYTIPSLLAKLLHQNNRHVLVVNFGEAGYVSTQDLILYLRQLQLGPRPGVAVFYQGLGEVYGAVGTGYAGASIREHNRVREYNLGRWLYDRSIESEKSLSLLRLGNIIAHVPKDDQTIEEVAPGLNISLVAKKASHQAILEVYLKNLHVIRILSTAYGVRPLFVWQPTPWIAKPLVEYEKMRVDAHEKYRPGTRRMFLDVDSELQRHRKEQSIENFLDLSRLFERETQLVYIDQGHYTEDGHQRIAQALLQEVCSLLDKKQ